MSHDTPPTWSPSLGRFPCPNCWNLARSAETISSFVLDIPVEYVHLSDIDQVCVEDLPIPVPPALRYVAISSQLHLALTPPLHFNNPSPFLNNHWIQKDKTNEMDYCAIRTPLFTHTHPHRPYMQSALQLPRRYPAGLGSQRNRPAEPSHIEHRSLPALRLRLPISFLDYLLPLLALSVCPNKGTPRHLASIVRSAAPSGVGNKAFFWVVWYRKETFACVVGREIVSNAG
jgi:hypothetical protein